jgi:hypothetical protein
MWAWWVAGDVVAMAVVLTAVLGLLRLGRAWHCDARAEVPAAVVKRVRG